MFGFNKEITSKDIDKFLGKVKDAKGSAGVQEVFIKALNVLWESEDNDLDDAKVAKLKAEFTALYHVKG